MADSKTVRAWARAKGIEVPARGLLPGHVREAYNMAHPDNPAGPVMTVANGSDVPGDDEFGPTAYGEPPDGDPGWTTLSDSPERPQLEQRPQRPAAPRTGKAAAKGNSGAGRPPAGLLGRLRGARAPGPAKGSGRPAPRVSTAGMLAGAWRLAAKLAAPLPPLQRTLVIQSRVAGDLLEDSVKGTVVDRVLQPFARLQRQGKAVGALLGPPVIVTALTLHVQQAQLAGRDPNPLFVATGMEALRASLMIWMEVSGPKFEAAIRNEREFEEKYGQSVDDLMMLLLAPPPQTPAEAEAENAAMRRAQGYTEAA